MAKSVLELAVGTGQWDAGLKKAKSALDNFTQANGGLQQALDKESQKMQKFVQMMGGMESTAKTAKGQMNDYKGTIEQLTMQYNRMTEAQKKVIGQDYLQAIEQMKQRYQSVNEEIQEMNRSLNNVKMPDMKDGGGGLFSGLGDKMSGALQVFAGNMLTKAAGAVANLGSEMYGMVQQGVEMARQGEGIRIAFERLGRGDILQGLREATHGTVTDLELMKAAVKFNDFKLPLDQLGTMLAFAQQKAKDTGQSVDYMVESITNGLGRQSKPILDNLGISAKEIEERMKSTGDFTKAVGEIIRDQMAKAGDYVETAADRATKADVELKNAMEELGRTFRPLTDAGTSMFTALEVGALKFLSKVGSVIAQLTEAGRIASLYNNQGGSGQVSNMLNYLKSIKTDKYRQGTYKLQVGRFNEKINSYQQYLDDYKAWRDNKSIAAYDRMKAFQQRTGLSYYSDVKEQMGVYQRELNEYIQGAAGILNPTVPTKTTSNPKKTTKETKTEQTELQKNQAKINALTQQFVDINAEAARVGKPLTEEQKKQTEEIQKHIEELKQRNGLLNLFAEQAQGRLTLGSGDFQHDGLSNTPGTLLKAPTTAVYENGVKTEKAVPSGGLQLDDKAMKAVTKNLEKQQKKNEKKEEKKEVSLSEKVGEIAGGVSGMFSGLQQLGIELPEGLQGVLNGITGVTQVLTSIMTIVSAIQTITAADSIIPFANGGVVRAAGGVVAGNTYSNDQIPALLNAGEVVLNRAQVGNLASQLQGGGMQNLHLEAEIGAEKIKLVLNNRGRRTGRGEYVQSSNRV